MNTIFTNKGFKIKIRTRKSKQGFLVLFELYNKGKRFCKSSGIHITGDKKLDREKILTINEYRLVKEKELTREGANFSFNEKKSNKSFIEYFSKNNKRI